MVLEKTLESPLDCKESNQSILKEIRPEYSLEGLRLKLKLHHFGHLMRRADFIGKDPDAWTNLRQQIVSTVCFMNTLDYSLLNTRYVFKC